MKLEDFIALYRDQNPNESNKSQSEILNEILDRAAIKLPSRVEKRKGWFKVKAGAFNPHLLYDELRRIS